MGTAMLRTMGRAAGAGRWIAGALVPAAALALALVPGRPKAECTTCDYKQGNPVGGPYPISWCLPPGIRDDCWIIPWIMPNYAYHKIAMDYRCCSTSDLCYVCSEAWQEGCCSDLSFEAPCCDDFHLTCSNPCQEC